MSYQGGGFELLDSLMTTREGAGAPHDVFFNEYLHLLNISIIVLNILIAISYQGGGFELLDDNEGGYRGPT